WLTQIGLKAIEYTEDPKGTGEKGPSWEDSCGAIASIECPACKAYCELLVWGDYRDNTQAFAEVCKYITRVIYSVGEEWGSRRNCGMQLMCIKVAYIEVYYHWRSKLIAQSSLQGLLILFGITELNADGFARPYKYLTLMVGCIIDLFKEQ